MADVPNKRLFLRSKSHGKPEKCYKPIHAVTQSSQKIIANYVLNYVATIKGHFGDIKRARDLVNRNQLREYNKNHRPVYLRIISNSENKTELVCKRIHSATDKRLQVCDIKIDYLKANYIYLVSIDNLEEHRSRTHIFNLLNETMIGHIRQEWPNFGSTMDALIMGYTVPTDMDVVLRHIQIYCLSKMGQYVTDIKRYMSLPLQEVFKKHGTLNSNSLDYDSIKPRLYQNKAKNTNGTQSLKLRRHPRIMARHAAVREKSRSIENLLTYNAEMLNLEFDGVKGSPGGAAVLQRSSSMIKSTAERRPDDTAWFYKFENVVGNPIGLQHFKKFLKEEFSAENIQFWEDVNIFVEIQDPEKVQLEAQRIFYVYVQSSSETPVNLDYHTIENIRSKLDQATVNLFDEAQNHIYQLMKSDSFNRFLISKHFLAWKAELGSQDNQSLKPASSTSSLNQGTKQRSFFPHFLKGSRGKLSKDGSRKSSAQTLNSDTTNPSGTTTCRITLFLDNPNPSLLPSPPEEMIYSVSDKATKKLGSVLKKLNPRFNNSTYTAFFESDLRIVSFMEPMANLYGLRVAVEKSCLIRVGLLQDNMDTVIYENMWFVIRPRGSFCLSNALNCIVAKFKHSLEQYVAVSETNTQQIIPWHTIVSSLHASCILLIEKFLYKKIKLFSKPLPEVLSNLWKNILRNYNYLASLKIDENNVIDSRDAFDTSNLEPRRIGYILSKSLDDRLEGVASADLCEVSGMNLAKYSLNQTSSSSSNEGNVQTYEDQRGLCTGEQLRLPYYLREDVAPTTTSATGSTSPVATAGLMSSVHDETEGSNSDCDVEESTQRDRNSSFGSSYKRYSSINFGGGDSDSLFFSEIDEGSDPSPTRLELISDFE